MSASDSLAKNVQEMQAQARVSQQLIQDGQKELAGLRYAILEAWRLGAQITKDRVEAVRHDAVSLTRTVAALSSTSLSTAQRGLANWLQSSVERWVEKQAETLSCLQIQVERPVFQEREFDFTELINGVFKAIQATSVEQDFVAQTSIVGESPGQVRGDATHIHQLLTMLTDSVCQLVDLRRLESQVSIEPSGSGPDALTIQLVLTADRDANEARAHLAGITAASGTLQTPMLDRCGIELCRVLANGAGHGRPCAHRTRGGPGDSPLCDAADCYCSTMGIGTRLAKIADQGG